MSNPRYSESLVVGRPPEDLYDMVSDVTRMGEWSPVCRACWWDDGEGPGPGPGSPAATSCPSGPGRPAPRSWRRTAAASSPSWSAAPGVRWGYTFAPVDGGTRGHRVLGVPARRDHQVPRALRRRRRGPDRRTHRGRAAWHPGHAGRDQAGRRGRLTGRLPGERDRRAGLGGLDRLVEQRDQLAALRQGQPGRQVPADRVPVDGPRAPQRISAPGGEEEASRSRVRNPTRNLRPSSPPRLEAATPGVRHDLQDWAT